MNPGIYSGLSSTEYHSVKAFSQSGFKHLKKSPAHFRAWQDNPTKRTKAMEFGTAAHAYILQEHVFQSEFIVAPEGLDFRTTAGKQFAKDSKDQAIISYHDMESIKRMKENVLAHPVLGEILAFSEKEASVFWTDKRTGVLCKCRPDAITGDGYILDLKTTEDASLDGVMSSMKRYAYHLQAAWYMHGVSQHKPTSGTFVFGFIEKEPPFDVAVYEFDYASLEKAEEQCHQLLDSYKQCVDKNEWPGYSKEVVSINLPSYMW